MVRVAVVTGSNKGKLSTSNLKNLKGACTRYDYKHYCYQETTSRSQIPSLTLKHYYCFSLQFKSLYEL